jgi:exodeoxyribonuclease-3
LTKIATWNVNSLNVRLEHVIDWVKTHNPDILCLQETKQTNDKFSHEAFDSIGYKSYHNGQKTYNGVAIISNKELQNVGSDIPGFSDPQKRIIHGLYPSRSLGLIHVVSAYVPNGQSLDSEKFKYKVSWLEAFNTWVKSSYGKSDHHILTGDFNIAPSDIDCHDPEAWKGNILVSQIERDLFDAIIDIGFDDSFRVLNKDIQKFSWWDYRMAGFRRNLGMRIDHILTSHSLKETLTTAYIDEDPRKLERPSDHTPVITEFR